MADTLVTLAAYSAAAEKLLFALPDWSAIGSETNATTTATATAKAGIQRCADSVVVSFSAAPATVLTFQVTNGAGGTVLFQCQIPAAATAPITIPLRGIRAAVNTALVATMGAAGGTTVGTIAMKGIDLRAP